MLFLMNRVKAPLPFVVTLAVTESPGLMGMRTYTGACGTISYQTS